MSEPREIKAEEVRFGDTIRIWLEDKVCGIDGAFIGLGERFLRKIDGYNITLLNRPLPEHKYKVGQKVVVPFKEHWEARITELFGHYDDGEPRYKVGGFENIYRESKLTPVVEEPAWEPKWGEFVKWNNKKSFVVAYDGISTCIIPEQSKRLYWVWLSELSKWEDE